MRKKCPKCNLKFGGIERYCTQCGAELEKNSNWCSEGKDVNCSRFPRRDEDVFCPFCGSLTTYELERQKNGA